MNQFVSRCGESVLKVQRLLAQVREQAVGEGVRARNKRRAAEFMLFAAGVMLFQVSRTAVNVLSARTLGPVEYAPWNVMQPIINYFSLVTLGIPNAMNREIPFLIGSGDPVEAQITADISFTSSCLLILFGALGCGVLSMYGFSGLSRGSLLLFSLLLVSWHLYNFAQVLLKSRIEFKRMSLQLACYGFLYPVLTLWGVNVLGFEGFLIGNALTALLIALFIFYMSPTRVRWKFNIGRSLGLARIGWPIMGAGLIFAVFASLDRWLVAAFLGKQALGYYTLAAISSGLFVLIPSIVSQQIYPRIAHEYGRSRNVRNLKRFILLEMSINLVIMIPLVVCAFILLPVFVERYLPAYVHGVSAARIIIGGMLPLCIVTAVGSFLNVISRQMWYFTAQFIGIVCNISMGIVFVQMGKGIQGVATSTAISYLVYALSVIAIGYYAYRQLTREVAVGANIAGVAR